MSEYIFKTANSGSEKQAIHSLNYRTFVDEIPQYLPNSEQVLVDRKKILNDLRKHGGLMP